MRRKQFMLFLIILLASSFILSEMMYKDPLSWCEPKEFTKDSDYVYEIDSNLGVKKNTIQIFYKDGVTIKEKERIEKKYKLQSEDNSGFYVVYKINFDKTLTYNETYGFAALVEEFEKDSVDMASPLLEEHMTFCV